MPVRLTLGLQPMRMEPGQNAPPYQTWVLWIEHLPCQEWTLVYLTGRMGIVLSLPG